MTVSTHPAVSLTAHPLQRVGALALARLAGAGHPDRVGEPELALAVQVMHDDLGDSVSAEDSKDEGGFWLGASYLFWPNSRLPNTTDRRKLSLEERRDRLRQWRTLPGPDETIGVPCALCSRPACGFYGKVDVALGASVLYRNTTPRGHEGLALCRGCLASFHALPYGCAIAGGRATVLHSWDEQFLQSAVRRQVRRTRQNAAVGAGSPGGSLPYARQVAALRQIRGYEHRITEGVDLMVFSNSNQEQALEVHQMDQPLAEWVRDIRYRPDMADGWRYLKRAHGRPKVPGLSALARDMFSQPGNVIRTAAGYLCGLADGVKLPPGETPALAVICCDYATKVLAMKNSDADEIRVLARNVAGIAGRDKSDFTKFIVAWRSNELRKWLRAQAVDRIRFAGGTEPFVSERQWRLLFTGEGAYVNRELLLVCALEEVHRLDPKWQADEASARADQDDTLNDAEEKAGDE